MALSVSESVSRGKRMILPATLEAIDPARDAFEDFLNDAGISHEDCHAWLLIFTEAIVNAIRHGSNLDPEKIVSISWNQEGDVVTVAIQDSGNGPPANRLNELELEDDGNPESTSGRGLFLIHHFCDRLEHWNGPQGYQQVLYKRHPGIPAPTDGSDQDGILEQALAEISLCYESLAAFYRLGDALIHSNTIASFIEKALKDLKHVVPADDYILSYSSALQQSIRDELNTIPGSQLSTDENDPECVREALKKELDIIWDAEDPERFRLENNDTSYQSGSCIPIRAGDTTLGALTWLRTESYMPFNAAQINTLRTFSDLFGIAIATANHAVVRSRENQALKELEIASTIQNTLLPTRVPDDYDASRLIVRRVSAREVSGDYAEALYSPNGSLHLVIVDVMGKGVSAAFLAVMIRTATRILLENDLSLTDLSQKLNRIVCSLVGEMTLFATVAVAKVDAISGRIDVINAGHSNVLLFPRDQGEPYGVSPSGPPMGIFDDSVYPVESFNRLDISSIILVTDGLFEWETNDEIWGWDAFYDFTLEHIDDEPDVFWTRIQTHISQYSSPQSLADDQTCIIWKNKKN